MSNALSNVQFFSQNVRVSLFSHKTQSETHPEFSYLSRLQWSRFLHPSHDPLLQAGDNTAVVSSLSKTHLLRSVLPTRPEPSRAPRAETSSASCPRSTAEKRHLCCWYSSWTGGPGLTGISVFSQTHRAHVLISQQQTRYLTYSALCFQGTGTFAPGYFGNM